MEKTDVLTIGGSASGIVAATTGKSFHPDRKFLLIRNQKEVLVPCGIPYMFGSLENSSQNLIGDAVLSKAGVNLKVDQVTYIDQKAKVCTTADGTEIGYEKLVLALGSSPYVPAWLKGANLKNVFLIPKDKEYIDNLIKSLSSLNKIVIVGGGFIGVEISDELKKRGKEVTIIEIMPHILESAFDDDFVMQAEEVLKSRGVKIKTGDGVKELLGDDKVNGVLLNSGEKLEAEAVLLVMGYRPNTALAEKSGIKLNEMGFIKVNDYMRTENPDIFAVGDCAGKQSFITGTLRDVMLASTACAEARIAALNLFNLCVLKTFRGTIAIYSTVIGDTAFGVAGVTERLAKQRGFRIATGSFEGVDKHPGTLKGTHKQFVKLIASLQSGVIIGGQVIGGVSTGELTNLIGLAVENRMTVHAILTAQVGTHPLLTAPPTAYPLIKAAEMIERNRWMLK
jgi:NADH oxidase (H2O2-forming)